METYLLIVRLAVTVLVGFPDCSNGRAVVRAHIVVNILDGKSDATSSSSLTGSRCSSEAQLAGLQTLNAFFRMISTCQTFMN